MFSTIRIQGIQRRGDGKYCAPLPPKDWGARWASLAIFYLALGLDDVCTWETWNLPSEGTGFGGFRLVSQSSRRGQCTGTSPRLIRCKHARVPTETRSSSHGPHHHHHRASRFKAVEHQCRPQRALVCTFSLTLAVDMLVHSDGASGAARRRRERRLRSWWNMSSRASRQRWSQPCITVVRSTKPHGDRRRPPRRRRQGSRRTLAYGHRRPCLRGCGQRAWQSRRERVQRHTVEQLGELAPMVQILDAPVPQMVDQPMDVLTRFDIPVSEQVIEVPKISCLSRPLFARFSGSRRWRSSWWTCQEDIPVPLALLQGFLPGQGPASWRGGRKRRRGG